LVTISTLAILPFALSSWSSSTSMGTSAMTDGSTRISPAVMTNATTQRCHTAIWPLAASHATASITRPRHAWVDRISQRRLCRSTSAPPSGATDIHGRNCAAVIELTNTGDDVRRAASSGRAVSRMPSPALEINDPANNARKSGPKGVVVRLAEKLT
jgi:hypothetical protein